KRGLDASALAIGVNQNRSLEPASRGFLSRAVAPGPDLTGLELGMEFSRTGVKAWKGLAASSVLLGAAGLGALLAWNAGLFSPVSAAEAGGGAELEAARAEQQAFTEIYLARETREARMAEGESLAGLLTRAGASAADASAAVASIAAVYNPRGMQPGQAVAL